MFVNAGTSGLFDLLATNMHNGQTANMKEFTVHAHLLLILRVLWTQLLADVISISQKKGILSVC